MGQGAQPPPEGAGAYPGPHEQLVAPAREVKPAPSEAQLVHVLALVAPVAAEKVPAAHGEGVLAPAGQKLPAGHGAVAKLMAAPPLAAPAPRTSVKRRLAPPYKPEKVPEGATEPVAVASAAARRRRPDALSMER